MIHMERRLWLMTSLCTLAAASQRDCSCFTDKMTECQAMVTEKATCSTESLWSFGPCGGGGSDGSGQTEVSTAQCCPRTCCDLEAFVKDCAGIGYQHSPSLKLTDSRHMQKNLGGDDEPNIDDMEDEETEKFGRKDMKDDIVKFTCGIHQKNFKELMTLKSGLHTIAAWGKLKAIRVSKDRFERKTELQMKLLLEEIDAIGPLVKLWLDKDQVNMEELKAFFEPEGTQSLLKDSCIREHQNEEEETGWNGAWDELEVSFTKKAKQFFEGKKAPQKAEEHFIVDACVQTVIGLTVEEAGEITKNPYHVDCYKRCNKLASNAEDLFRETFQINGSASTESKEVFGWSESVGLSEESSLGRKEDELKRLIAETEECKMWWKEIERFQFELKILQTLFETAAEMSKQSAKNAIAAQASLDDAKAGEVEAQALESQAMAALASATAETSDAEEALKRVMEQLNRTQIQAQEAVLMLQRATSDFKAANEAFKQITVVKSHVVEIVSAMRGYYYDMVVDPMVNMGFTRSNWELESPNPKEAETEFETEFGSFWTTMGESCTSRSTELSATNLTLLCGFAPLQHATNEILEAVKAKEQSMGHSVNPLISMQTPYWRHYDWNSADVAGTPCVGQMSEKNEQDKEAEECETWLDETKGEPASLRRVIGIFEEIGFYKDYLRRWRFDDPESFLQLSKDFQEALATANQTAEEFQKKKAELDQALQQAEAAVKDAEDIWKKAEENLRAKDIGAADATKALQTFKAQAENQLAQFQKLTEHMDNANKGFQEAAEAYSKKAEQGKSIRISVTNSMLELLAEVVPARPTEVQDAIHSASQTMAAIKAHGLVQSLGLPEE